MNGRFNRLVYSVCLLLCCGYSVPLIAASEGVYRPVNVATVSRDLSRFKMENRYHLEKMATQTTNPFGTMPKNKALTVTTGKATLGNIARNAKKGTALNLAVMGAVAGAGWAIDELTNQVTRPVQVSDGTLDPLDIYQEGYYWIWGDKIGQSPLQILKDNYPGQCFTFYGWSISGTSVQYDRFSCSNMNKRLAGHAVTRRSCSDSYEPSVCRPLEVTPVYENLPVPNADFDDEILPKLGNVPSHHWDPEFKDSAGRPKMTPELQDALHDWYQDLADRDPNLTYNRATGKFTYSPPPDPSNPDDIPDPVDIDATPPAPERPDEWNEPQAGSDWPGFCDWATVVCDWIEWTMEEPDYENEPFESDSIPVEEVDLSDFKQDYNSGLGSGSCPAPVSFGYGGHSFSYSFEPGCVAASYIKPILIAAAGIIAALIIGGARREF